MTASYQVGPGTWVRLRYSAFDSDGERVEEGSHELGYVHGYGVLLPRLEQAAEGRRLGERCRITLSAEEAFGSRREEAVLECDPQEFPPDIQAGDRLEATTDDDAVLVLRVLEVRPDVVVVDTNHPLAGQSVSFELEFLEVRPAEPAELARAKAQLEADVPAEGPLIPLQSLLRDPSRRYEREQSAETGQDARSSGDDET